MSRITRFLILILISAIGLWAVIRAGHTFFVGAYNVIAYLLTSKHPVASYTQSLNNYVAPYESNADYSVSYVANSKIPLSLDQNQRRSTLNRLGRMLPHDPVIPDLGSEDLPTEYGHFLRDNIAALAQDDHNRTPLLIQLISSLNGAIGNAPLVTPSSKALLGAEKILASRPPSDELQRARRMFNYYGQFLTGDALDYEVYSDPSKTDYENMVLISASEQYDFDGVVTAPMDAFAISGDRQLGKVRVVTSKVLSNIRFRRSWLDEALLDDESSQTQQLRLRYFGKDAPLALIPEFMVVDAGEDIQFQASSKEDGEAIRLAISKNTCCELRNDTMRIRVYPGSISEKPRDRFRGRSFPRVPVVLALVSRHRRP
jgi:hypothetical protein